MFIDELGFSPAVALNLYVDQGLSNSRTILRLKDKSIEKMILAIQKEDPSLVIPFSAVENPKLLVYYLKHRQRTSRPHDALWRATLQDLDRISHHLDVEMNWDKMNAIPEMSPMTIDQGSAAKFFTALTVILGKFRGHDDVPLTYVIRPRILPPTGDSFYGAHDHWLATPLWQPGFPYSSIDEELKLRAPILKDPKRALFVMTNFQELENDPSQFPRCDAFNTDNAQIFRILQSHWGKSPAWSQAKQFSKSQDGCAAYRKIHDFLLGISQIYTPADCVQQGVHRACEHR